MLHLKGVSGMNDLKSCSAEEGQHPVGIGPPSRQPQPLYRATLGTVPAVFTLVAQLLPPCSTEEVHSTDMRVRCGVVKCLIKGIESLLRTNQVLDIL